MYSNNNQEETLHIMTYTLNSGIKGTVPLSNSQIKQWLECYKTNIRFVTQIGKEYFGINPALVADFKVHNEFSSHPNVIVARQHDEGYTNTKSLTDEFQKNEVLIHIDCSCGTAYTTGSSYYRTKWYCTKCKEIVFLDKSKGMLSTSKGDAHYMTNKYFVQRD